VTSSIPNITKPVTTVPPEVAVTSVGEEDGVHTNEC
jgi:hypothetical protein